MDEIEISPDLLADGGPSRPAPRRARPPRPGERHKPPKRPVGDSDAGPKIIGLDGGASGPKRPRPAPKRPRPASKPRKRPSPGDE
jgi:hypothetical protein